MTSPKYIPHLTQQQEIHRYNESRSVILSCLSFVLDLRLADDDTEEAHGATRRQSSPNSISFVLLVPSRLWVISIFCFFFFFPFKEIKMTSSESSIELSDILQFLLDMPVILVKPYFSRTFNQQHTQSRILYNR